MFVLGGNDTTHKVNLVSGVDYNTIEFSDTDFGIVNRCNDSGAFMLPEQKNKKGEKSQIMRFTVPEDLSVGETRYLCTDWDIGGDEVEVPAVDGNSNFIDYIEVKKNQLDYTLEIDDEANAKCYCKIFNSCYPDKDPVMLVLGAYDDLGATVHKADISGSYYDSIEFSSYSLGIDDRCYETGAYAYEITDNIMGGKTRVIKFKMPPHEYKFNDKDDYGHPLTETNPGCLSQNINQDHDDPITKKAKEKEQEKKEK